MKSSTTLSPFHRREDFGYSRTVSYNNRDTWQLITQRWGSINHKLIPLCSINVGLCVLVMGLQKYFEIDLTININAHELMSILVSFLVTTNLSSTVNTYYELQGYIEQMCQSVIDVAQLSCSYTSANETGVDRSNTKNNNSTDPSINELYENWRYEVCFYSAVLLKATAGLLYRGGTFHVWKMNEFGQEPLLLHPPENENDVSNKDNANEGQKTLNYSLLDEFHPRVTFPKELYLVGHNLASDLNLRVPIRVSQQLQKSIMKHRQLPTPLTDMQETQVMDGIHRFMVGYRGCRKYETAPLPLPLCQLGRIFVYAYVFTLPLALLDKSLDLKDVQTIVMVFLVSYGFLGCELLFMELDDPFAEDPNGLPLFEEGRAAIDDIAISLQFVDGKKSALKLVKSLSPMDTLAFYEYQVQQNQPLFPLKKNRQGSSSRIPSQTPNDETVPLLQSA